MAKSDQPTTIKKYANRRLYNTGTSTYVTLEDLAAMVKEGEDFLDVQAVRGAPHREPCHHRAGQNAGAGTGRSQYRRSSPSDEGHAGAPRADVERAEKGRVRALFRSDQFTRPSWAGSSRPSTSLTRRCRKDMNARHRRPVLR